MTLSTSPVVLMSVNPEAGVILGFFSGLSFALGDVLVRAASTGLSPRANLLISLLVGTPAAAAAAVIAREGLPSIQATYLYVLAGLLNFVVGRLLFYYSIAYAGAATSSVVTSMAIPLASLFAWALLSEEPGVGEVIGLASVTAAAVLASVRVSGEPLGGGSSRLGVLAGLSAAVVFALSSPTVRAASAVGGAPLWGMSISYAAAIPFATALGWRDLVAGARLRQARFMVAAALSTAVAQMLRYSALSVARVATVVVAIGMFPVHTVILSALLLRRGYGERLGLNHVVAAALAVMGIAATSVLR